MMHCFPLDAFVAHSFFVEDSTMYNKILLMLVFGTLQQVKSADNSTWGGVASDIENHVLDTNYSRESENSLNCTDWPYKPGEYRKIANGSIVIGDYIIDHIKHGFSGDVLFVCDEDYDYHKEDDRPLLDHSPTPKSPNSLIYIGNIGCGLSVVALLMYLAVFFYTPELKNLPGCNLTSVSISLLLGYSFFLVAQIRDVVGTHCMITAILHQYFFLVSFFWMNIISYDVWRTLRNATKKLRIISGKFRVRLLLYSLYSWGVPMMFTVAAVAVDLHPDSPEHLRPAFGKNNYCVYNGVRAKLVFFIMPAVVVLVTNTIFFVLSVCMVMHNRMKEGDGNKAAAKKNFMLYSRLGIIMGFTWTVGTISVFAEVEVLHYIFTLLNSTQGIFIFLLFCCTRKVWEHGSKRFRQKSLGSSLKHTTSDSAATSQPV